MEHKTDDISNISAKEVIERMLALEGAVQRVMAVVSSVLPHTTVHFTAINIEWGQIIDDIKRDCACAKPL